MKDIIDHLTKEIKKRTNTAVIGMSGGADSTLVAILLKIALGAENVYSVHMPYNELDKKTFNSNSIRIADKLGIKKIIIPIEKGTLGLQEELENNFKELNLVNKGNLRSRMRMCTLYAISHDLNSRVIGTGNLSEDFIGYDTKGGDALADFFPIGDLFKSEVFKLLDYFVDKGIIDADMVDRVPSAGLWDGQTDEDELGYPYNEMENSIRLMLDNKEEDSEVFKFVKERHLKNKHKHSAPEVIKLRKLLK